MYGIKYSCGQKSDSKPALEAIQSKVQHWKPFSSLGSLYMWKIWGESKKSAPQD
jgi:hypothetical protein